MSHWNFFPFHADCNKILTSSCNSWPLIGAPYIHPSTSGLNSKRGDPEREASESSSESSESILSVDADFNMDHKELNDLVHILSQPYMTDLRKQGVFDFEAEAEASLNSKRRQGNFISFTQLKVDLYQESFKPLVAQKYFLNLIE